ncbi:hypothetical protein F7734_03465 [Scytonema sp. UIC 10036]|nr:hypothetical protein [Scytonema sp. UIC 10036]
MARDFLCCVQSLDTMVEARQEREELRDGVQELRVGMLQLRNVVERLTNIQEGVANLLASLDDDRPTILRKLTAIELKVDTLLQKEQESQ